MRQKLTFFFVLFTYFISAQNFKEIPTSDYFSGVINGSIACSDVNNDNSQDILITGWRNPNSRIAKLYINDGTGNFTIKTNTPFEGVRYSSSEFSDVNNDNNQDVLITGRNSSGEAIAKLYINDGSGNFTEKTNTPFEGVWFGSIAFSDVNNDNNQDVLITGWNSSGEAIAKLYINDGSGNFIEMANTPFEGVGSSSVAFSDVNSDNHQDVLITGQNNSGERIAKLYINDGSGNFTEMSNTSFIGVANSSIAFSDVNNNGHQDVIISGSISLGETTTKLYINDGSGNFTETLNTPFVDIEGGDIAFADVNKNGNQDVLITGHSIVGPTSILFLNDGTGNFIEASNNPFEDVEASSIAFCDINGDECEDVLTTGQNIYAESNFNMYTNDGTGVFSKVLSTPFIAVANGSISFSDVNNDGNHDVLITGMNNILGAKSHLYINDGNGNFTKVVNTLFTGVFNSSAAFLDFDSDGYQDVLISGNYFTNGRITKLYNNTGTGQFTTVQSAPFEDVGNCSIATSDINVDGFQDVLITGDGGFNTPISKLYTNDGTGNFTEELNTPFKGVMNGSIAFSDINNDGLQDVLITGGTPLLPIAKLYINNGAGSFTEVINTPFEEVNFGSIAFSDVNNDSFTDVLITGKKYFGDAIAKLYINNGNENFTEALNTPFEGVWYSSVAFSDVNNDNYQDVLISGENNIDEPITKLYINDGTGNFIEEINTPFEGVRFSCIAFSDVNNDNFNDVIITGENSLGEPIAKLYINEGLVSQTNNIKIKDNLNFILYPNPNIFSKMILSYESNDINEVIIKVYSTNGTLLMQQKRQSTIGEQTFSIDTSFLPKGSYLIELSSGKRRGISKFIIP